jgi:serine/threonine protein phosphatase PrpC
VALFAAKNLPILLKGSPSFKAGNYEQALAESFIKIDELLESVEGKKQLAEISAQCPKKNGIYPQMEPEDIANCVGCTACVALITKTEIYVANAGDSRCVLSLNGTAVDMSKDHKPDLESEKKRIVKAEGYVEENRINGSINLSRSLGDLDYKQNPKFKRDSQLIIPVPDIKVEAISPTSQFLIIACDGIWDCLTSKEAVDFVAKKIGKGKLSTIIEEMMDTVIPSEINEKGGLGCDNMTCIVVSLHK